MTIIPGQVGYVCFVNSTETKQVETKPAILCLIDFSEASKQALEWAAAEARKLDTHLTVLYPYRLTQVRSKSDLGNLRQGIDAEAVNNFQSIAKGMLETYEVDYEFKPEVGFINDRVFAHSHKKDFSLMVISKHMALTNKESMSELIDLIKFPLVIVPQHKP